MRTPTRWIAAATATATTAAAAAIAAALWTTTAAVADTPERLSGPERRVLHDATKQYRDLDVAIAAGYVAVGGCAELPGVGGMGYHYLQPELAGDGVVDPARPELLVYRSDHQDRLRLAAVEYFVADGDQDLATDGDRPSLFDRYPFLGPMEGHEPGMPVHYDLHVWLYHHNTAGQLADWNPRVSCP